MAAPVESPKILVESALVHAATWREVYVTVWHQRGSASEVSRVYDVQRAFAKRLGRERMITISVVDARAAVTLDADVRRVIEEGTHDLKENLKASAIVIATTGFAAAAIRSLISALMMVHRPGYPTRVFDGADAACTWGATFLAPGHGLARPDADLRTVLRNLASSGQSVSAGAVER